MSNNQDPVTDATGKINAILADLEKQTGQVGDFVGIHDIEVTSIADARPQFLRSVRLEMKRLPGTHWMM